MLKTKTLSTNIKHNFIAV